MVVADERVDRLGRGAGHVEPALEAHEHDRTIERADVAGAELENLHRIHVDPRECQLSASTTWSMERVRASTSDGSIAGNMAMRSWLRPNLR